MTLGMLLEPGDVVLTHGCMEALQLALRVTTKPGDCVGLESPTYFYLLPLLASLGLKALEIPTDPQLGLSLDALELLLNEKRLNAVIAMPTVQNPLGCTMPLAAKKRLARLMNDHQVPLIEDGLYAEIQFGGALSPAVKAFDRDGWVLFCSSFTKTLAPDFRVGWICGGRFHEALRKLKAVSSMSESQLLSETLATFLESGGYDHHLRNLRKRYAAQVDEARALIARHFPRGTLATQLAGGFVFWSNFPGVDSVALFHQLLEEQICLTPGTLYSPSGRYRNALRLSCCYPFNARYTGVGPARRQGLRDERPAARHCARRVTARAFATMPVSLISVPFWAQRARDHEREKAEIKRLSDLLDALNHKDATVIQQGNPELIAQHTKEEAGDGDRTPEKRARRELSAEAQKLSKLPFSREITKKEQADMGALKKSARGLIVVHPMTALGREMGLKAVTGYAKKAF